MSARESSLPGKQVGEGVFIAQTGLSISDTEGLYEYHNIVMGTEALDTVQVACLPLEVIAAVFLSMSDGAAEQRGGTYRATDQTHQAKVIKIHYRYKHMKKTARSGIRNKNDESRGSLHETMHASRLNADSCNPLGLVVWPWNKRFRRCTYLAASRTRWNREM